MCSGQNSLGKGGLNAKAGFCYPYNNMYISFYLLMILKFLYLEM